MGKASKKPASKSAPSAPDAAAEAAPAAQQQQPQQRRSKRDQDPSAPAEQNPLFWFAVGMVVFAFVLLSQLSDKIYARYFGGDGTIEGGDGVGAREL